MYKYLILLLATGLVFISCDKDEKDEDPCNQPLTVDLGNDKIIQDGATVILNAGAPEPTFKYLWSTGEVTQTIIVDEPGDYWVKVTSCSHEDSDTVNVDISYPTIKIVTDFGDFRIWLYSNTPLHKTNFIDLTENSFYDSLIFHRVIFNFIIQGGDPDGTGYGGPGYTVPAEINPELGHDYGAVGAARLGNNVNPDKESNGSQFYIVTNPNGRHDLDGEYTVFGYVFDGMDAVFDISQVEVDGANRPIDDVMMNSVVINYFTAKELEGGFGFAIP